MTLKIKVGTLLLTESRDESLPQDFAAWHQTVRVAPGTYDVFAYLEPQGGGTYHVGQLSATCPGITISSNFRSHLMGTWGKSDNNRNGQPATAHVGLPTFGLVDTPMPSLLAQITLCDALVRTEWDPREINPLTTTPGKMWRFTWNPERKPIIIEEPHHGGGGLCLAAFEDQRQFCVDDVPMSSAQITELDISFLRLNQLSIHETANGWSFRLNRSCKVTRLA